VDSARHALRQNASIVPCKAFAVVERADVAKDISTLTYHQHEKH
jgi:hypothetical protein